jgi:hypothetical protein
MNSEEITLIIVTALAVIMMWIVIDWPVALVGSIILVACVLGVLL